MSADMLLREPGPTDHLVQLYETDLFLARRVGEYVAEGLARRQAAIMIATPAHRDAILRELSERSVDGVAARAAGRLAILDARETLSRFMSQGLPLWTRFEETIEPVVRQAESLPGVQGARAFGEMVDLLWQEGNLSAALRLERLWHALMSRHRFSLLCAYRMDPLALKPSVDSLHEVMKAHSHVVPCCNGALDGAIDQAFGELIGPRYEDLRALIAASQNTGPMLPWAESAVLWLRRNLPAYAPRVAARARQLLALKGAY